MTPPRQDGPRGLESIPAKRLWRAVVAVCTVLGGLAAAISVLTSLSLLGFSLALNAVLVIAVIVLALGLAGSQTPTADAANRASRAPATIAKAIPQAKAVTEFLGATLFSRGALSTVEANVDEAHYLSRFMRNCKISGYDIESVDIYEGTNLTERPTDGIPLITMGGSLVQFDHIHAHAEQHLNGETQDLTVELQSDSERIKIATIKFAAALMPHQSFKISYGDSWTGAMAYGCDALFYTPTYYFRQVGSVESCIEFEPHDIIESIKAYEYNTLKDVCQLTMTQPERVQQDGSETIAYEWVLQRPIASALYFIVFQRHRSDED